MRENFKPILASVTAAITTAGKLDEAPTADVDETDVQTSIPSTDTTAPFACADNAVIFNRELPAGRARFCEANGSVSAHGGRRGHSPSTAAAARLAIQNRFRGGDHALPNIDPCN